MNIDKANAALESVYAADTPEALAQAYAAWAATYDSETASLGYLLPFLIAAWVARHVPSGEGPLLDAGCGTGLSGPSLKALGYQDIAGLDLSDEMLDIAGSRQAYSELKQAMLGGPLPWPDGYFRAFFSTGVFTISHAPASGLHELVRITKKGGHAIFTVRDQVFESGGFRDVLAELERDKKWRLVEESPWFRCYAIAEPEALVKTFVFEVV
ncbi:MAG: class I SAM-dependent methyltransferase [Mesorhizobium sp.]|uniref:class I SAM-dependent DNA methyltransferase n=1 Tax=Mesorhizobium sp. TaxID=1871066 RepID=UPI000FE50CD3|nr:class I SAM-dependent methyltransferase [Mesorhizobium sp.]RWH70759.1 MAG: class I SAM-dependent methyltransferase [Mesorhizobium sp.]RWH83123.1 MAG: class I SAM-dependent methyltransferase [Mesorhizobium sp.]RWH91734.1 MAG: class I SAM-dependent methyltransferase [Mesorhizobium sp.]RWH92304.1 MAG: class I SAM-dependent methyltransferase [Mesorhizobium sp.]RWI06267.1 MAG: class I SAM-dependent methyltransferase [Mesorhizobium sp.]